LRTLSEPEPSDARNFKFLFVSTSSSFIVSMDLIPSSLYSH
jgi:hypothetical protein